MTEWTNWFHGSPDQIRVKEETESDMDQAGFSEALWAARTQWQAAQDEAIRATGTRVPDRSEEDDCPHDELDHGVCLDCGRDCWDDVVARAEFNADCMEDR